ncbi:MAG: hypothetical protein QNK04_25655 [Myxococcota bacterium]|nr:hypothetical protein [Myxococcota bacterium]
MKARASRAALLVLAGLAGLGAAPRDAHVDYLYVEPNVGTASAGHTALALGDRVYHFQNAGGDTLRSARTDADFFRYGYSVLENRTIHAARVDVDEETFERLREVFESRHRRERRDFARADGLRADRELAGALLHGETESPARLPGAGYFHPAEEGRSPSLVAIRDGVRAERGADFLPGRLAALDDRIRALSPEEGFAERHAELVLERLAVLTLLRALPLRAEHLRALPAGALPLQPAERAVLAAYAARLERRIAELLDSPRADRGRPLLVALARRVAIAHALRSDRLVVLDTFPPDALVVEGEALRARHAFLVELQARARARLEDERMAFALGRSANERGYQALEEAANRFLEYDEALASRRAVRMHAGVLVPSAEPRRLVAPAPEADTAALAAAVGTMRARERSYDAELSERYEYGLVSRNCVTEIFALIEHALGPDGSRERLGGHIEARSALRFIPARAFAAVRDTYRVAEVGEIRSLRRQRLQEMYESESPFLVYLRESNTLTSSVYRRNERDSSFVFFTDDAVAPRPLFGVFNLLTGLVELASGVVRLPFDGGESLVSGGKGALFSVPELFFVNIRKGSLEYARSEEPRTRLNLSER